MNTTESQESSQAFDLTKQREVQLEYDKWLDGLFRSDNGINGQPDVRSRELRQKRRSVSSFGSGSVRLVPSSLSAKASNSTTLPSINGATRSTSSGTSAGSLASKNPSLSSFRSNLELMGFQDLSYSQRVKIGTGFLLPGVSFFQHLKGGPCPVRVAPTLSVAREDGQSQIPEHPLEDENGGDTERSHRDSGKQRKNSSQYIFVLLHSHPVTGDLICHRYTSCSQIRKFETITNILCGSVSDSRSDQGETQDLPIAIVKRANLLTSSALPSNEMGSMGRRHSIDSLGSLESITIDPSIPPASPPLALLYTAESTESMIRELLTHPERHSLPVAVQKMVKHKGRYPWILRCLWKHQKKSSAWIISSSDSKLPYTSSSAVEQFQVTKSSEASWQPIREKLVSFVSYLEQSLDLRFNELVADFIQDQDGSWYLLQIKGYKVRAKPENYRSGGSYESNTLGPSATRSKQISSGISWTQLQKSARLSRVGDESELESLSSGRASFASKASSQPSLPHLSKGKPRELTSDGDAKATATNQAEDDRESVSAQSQRRKCPGERCDCGPRGTKSQETTTGPADEESLDSEVYYKDILTDRFIAGKLINDQNKQINQFLDSLPQRDRRRLYDRVKVCSNCHFYYEKQRRARQRRGKGREKESLIRACPQTSDTSSTSENAGEAASADSDKHFGHRSFEGQEEQEESCQPESIVPTENPLYVKPIKKDTEQENEVDSPQLQSDSLCRCAWGCGMRLRRCDLDFHERETCLRREEKCPQHCGVTLPVDQLELHTKEGCPYRQVVCPLGCESSLEGSAAGSLTYSSLPEHIEKHCIHRQELCRMGCGVRVQVSAQPYHEANLCGKRLVACRKGCGKKMAASKLSGHETECSGALPIFAIKIEGRQRLTQLFTDEVYKESILFQAKQALMDAKEVHIICLSQMSLPPPADVGKSPGIGNSRGLSDFDSSGADGGNMLFAEKSTIKMALRSLYLELRENKHCRDQGFVPDINFKSACGLEEESQSTCGTLKLLPLEELLNSEGKL